MNKEIKPFWLAVLLIVMAGLILIMFALGTIYGGPDNPNHTYGTKPTILKSK